ncbi:hypothetical protein CYLTODRAFT_362538 [Cylindrobasidium torrendii FP15055 ss-10]|uniref:Integrase core domain-containing protein n=1 Tax=Cylindrobasidium torrendii FP15055 ss-10 TaxID=1314674 RepID=A0A0D7AWN6_9AGAR|nr:hypothetical protein CYLTODRAFT_362538 [Cylindrobasidium torrendii FP15055 ss-10]
METSFGAERGSYIWGRSVHNIRIERLWRDITRDFGRKWKVFFEELEVAGDLHPDNSAHIWLLHYLFLAEVNRDAMEWAETWNSHTIRQGPQSVERQRSPRDMFFFGQLQNGWRDLSQYLPEEDPAYNDDPEGYGVDWEDLGNRDILIHHNVENSAESLLEVDDNSSAVQVTHRPANFAAVEVPVVDCPLTMEQFDMLNEHLVILPTYGGRDMRERRSLWRGALHYINSVIFGGSS